MIVALFAQLYIDDRQQYYTIDFVLRLDYLNYREARTMRTITEEKIATVFKQTQTLGILTAVLPLHFM